MHRYHAMARLQQVLRHALVLGLVAAMSLYIFVRMIAGVKEELRQKQQKI